MLSVINTVQSVLFVLDTRGNMKKLEYYTYSHDNRDIGTLYADRAHAICDAIENYADYDISINIDNEGYLNITCTSENIKEDGYATIPPDIFDLIYERHPGKYLLLSTQILSASTFRVCVSLKEQDIPNPLVSLYIEEKPKPSKL